MKRPIIFIFLMLTIGLCGCSRQVFSSDYAETLESWSFQYNEETDDYSVFFALLNKNNEYIAADVTADIRIEDEAGNILYSATRLVTKDDYGYYTSQVAGEQYLANIRIKADEVSEGTSTSGTVFLDVHKDGSIQFGEVTCKALFCLPTMGIELNTDPLPLELNVTGIDGAVESVIRIDEISYVFDNSLMPQIKVTILGTKTYGNSGFANDIIRYKLLDGDGYVLTTGNVILSSIDEGDKFKDDSIILYQNIVAGEEYTLKLFEYDW